MAVKLLLLFLPLVFPLGLFLFSGQPGLAYLLQGLTGVHDKGQSHAGSAITALPGEAQEGGPEEGAAAHEGRSHVQRHQDEVQKLGKGQKTCDITHTEKTVPFLLDSYFCLSLQ